MNTTIRVITIGIILSFFNASRGSAQDLDQVFNVVPTLPESRLAQATASPDGRFLVYINDSQLYRFSLENGNNSVPIKINNSNISSVSAFSISPDSSRVVYSGFQGSTQVLEVFSVSITGGTEVKLNEEFELNNRDVSETANSLLISPDGATVVYRADQIVDNRFEIFSVPITGGPVTRLSTNVEANNADVFESTTTISPDGKFVLYIADARSNGLWELYSVPIQGGEVIRLNPNPVFGGDVRFVTPYISPDSSRVVFISDHEINNNNQLYSVGIRGDGFVRLTIGENSNSISSNNISTDSSRIIFGEAIASGVSGLDIIEAALDASSRSIISPMLSDADTFSNLVLSDDGNFLLFNTNLGFHLMSLSTGEVTLLDERRSLRHSFTPDSKQIVWTYRHDTNSIRPIDLLVRGVNSGAENRTLATVVPNDDSDSLVASISKNSEWVVFYFPNKLNQGLNVVRIKDDNEELCFPVRDRNQVLTVVCL